ncbi:hypothetical protein C8J95_10619 [Elizabethkingia sp. YR214]|uniref:hypothetical protein n=1 Tax=Elizabethkingia sp. YR214 TaxID=2135667 RepID=UPI000D30AFDF|nr:hypothetical protein [Elizabethkingia sp. YR214]PUB29368.1 hypothetical protein C8J95_10619 [Elizabethkingia sp. YR214]
MCSQTNLKAAISRVLLQAGVKQTNVKIVDFNQVNTNRRKCTFKGFEVELSKSRVDIYLPEYNHISYSRIQNNFSSPSMWLATIEDSIMYLGITLAATAIYKSMEAVIKKAMEIFNERK